MIWLGLSVTAVGFGLYWCLVKIERLESAVSSLQQRLDWLQDQRKAG